MQPLHQVTDPTPANRSRLGFYWLGYVTRTGLLLNPVHILVLCSALVVFGYGAWQLLQGGSPGVAHHPYLSLTLDIALLGSLVVAIDLARACAGRTRDPLLLGVVPGLKTTPIEYALVAANLGIALNYAGHHLHQWLR